MSKRTKDEVRMRVRSTVERVVDAYDANPLAFGAGFLALGAAIGLAIPISHREHQLLGAHRDDLVRQVRGLAQGAVSQMGDVAKHLVDEQFSSMGSSKRENEGISAIEVEGPRRS